MSQNHPLRRSLIAGLLCLASIRLACADTEMAPAPMYTGPSNPPPFKATAEPREYRTGAEVSVYGGANLFQDGNSDLRAPGEDLKFDPVSHTGYVVGIKGGYTWPGWMKGPGFSEDSFSSDIDGSFHLLPSIEYEFFYFNREMDLHNGPNRVQSNLDSYNFMINPIMRAQWWIFRPYTGFGLGAADLVSNKPHISSPTFHAAEGGDPDDIVFAYQFLSGVDVFLTKNISLFGEGKMVNYVDTDFSYGAARQDSRTIMTDWLLVAGIKYHF